MRERLSFEFEVKRLGITPESRNEYWAEKLGWIKHIDQITQTIGLDFTPASVDDSTFMHGVARWQSSQGDIKPDGIIGPQTWDRLLRHAHPQAKSETNTLEVAKKLVVTRFAGWTYGKNRALKQINCVQFVRAVVEEINGSALPRPVKTDIEIAHPDLFNDIDQAISEGDPRLGGVSYAIEKYRMGKRVLLSEALSGDFIQYWYKNRDGKWNGHAAIIEKVVNDTSKLFVADIFGSHGSKNGIGTLRTKLIRKKLVYAARFTTRRQF